MSQEPVSDYIGWFHFRQQKHQHNSYPTSTHEHRLIWANRTYKFQKRMHKCCWIHYQRICLSCWRSSRCFWAKIHRSFDMKQHLLLLCMSGFYPMTMACLELRHSRCGRWGVQYWRRCCLKHSRHHSWGWWSKQSCCRRISSLILYYLRMIPLIANSLKR